MSNRVPFKGKDNDGIIKKNKMCDIKYKRSDWESVSKSGFIDIQLISYLISHSKKISYSNDQ